MKKLLTLLVIMLLVSCSEDIGQSYKDYDEYLKSTGRHKSWFPELISSDCYEIKEIHNLDNNNSFGRFSYRDNAQVDSAISDTLLYKPINEITYNDFLSKITVPEKPEWFLLNNSKGVKRFQKNNMVIANDTEAKKIFFAYSSLP